VVITKKECEGVLFGTAFLFEAMHWNGFDFTAPEELDGTGYYYYTHIHDAANTDLVRASFRTLWDEIQAEEKLLLISLWFHGQPSFPLDLSFEKKEGAIRTILLSLSDAYLIDLPLEQARGRLNHLLHCARSLHELCHPLGGKIYWEDATTSWAWFGHLDETITSTPGEQGGTSRKLVEETLSDGALMYLLDPVPIKVRGGWNMVSLLE
jgi:hypothetical protein